MSNHGFSGPRLESQLLTAAWLGATFPIVEIVEKDCSACFLELPLIQNTPQNLPDLATSLEHSVHMANTFACCLTQIYNKIVFFRIQKDQRPRTFSAPQENLLRVE
jgi:hypothetical protein